VDRAVGRRVLIELAVAERVAAERRKLVERVDARKEIVVPLVDLIEAERQPLAEPADRLVFERHVRRESIEVLPHLVDLIVLVGHTAVEAVMPAVWIARALSIVDGRG